MSQVRDKPSPIGGFFGVHEPWSEECSERPSPRPSPAGRGRIFPACFEGLGRVLAGTGRDGSDGWSSGMSPCGICDTLSPRERVGVREPVSTLAIASTERFLERTDLRAGLVASRLPLPEAESGWGTDRTNSPGPEPDRPRSESVPTPVPIPPSTPWLGHRSPADRIRQPSGP
jgi:hypothetical protein